MPGGCSSDARPMLRNSIPNRSIRLSFQPRVRARSGPIKQPRGRYVLGGTRMKSIVRTAALACVALLAAAASPALAQKKGGSLTVGVELDIPGFDPLKVGVYDTSAITASALMLETLAILGDDGKAKPKLALSWSSSDDF